MQKSQAIARLAGPVLCTIGVGMLAKGAVYRQMAGQFLAGYPFIYFSGILALVSGLAILNAQHSWTRDWRSAITALGWLLTCVGTFRIVAPQFAVFVAGSFLLSTEFFVGAGIGFVAFGGFITFKGYVA